MADAKEHGFVSAVQRLRHRCRERSVRLCKAGLPFLNPATIYDLRAGEAGKTYYRIKRSDFENWLDGRKR